MGAPDIAGACDSSTRGLASLQGVCAPEKIQLYLPIIARLPSGAVGFTCVSLPTSLDASVLPTCLETRENSMKPSAGPKSKTSAIIRAVEEESVASCVSAQLPYSHRYVPLRCFSDVQA